MATTTFIKGKGEARRVKIGDTTAWTRHQLIMAGWLPIDAGMAIGATVLDKDLVGTVRTVDNDEIAVELSAPWGRCKAGELVEVLTDEITVLDGRVLR